MARRGVCYCCYDVAENVYEQSKATRDARMERLQQLNDKLLVVAHWVGARDVVHLLRRQQIGICVTNNCFDGS